MKNIDESYWRRLMIVTACFRQVGEGENRLVNASSQQNVNQNEMCEKQVKRNVKQNGVCKRAKSERLKQRFVVTRNAFKT